MRGTIQKMNRKLEVKTVGYYNSNGIVGQYRGRNVYVIDYEVLKPAAPGDKTIYAVRGFRKDGLLELVQEDHIIGTMSDAGKVEIFNDRTEFNHYINKVKEEQKYVPVVVEAEKTSEPAPEPDPSAAALNVEFGYGEYSKIVDNFFEGLDKLWGELEV